MSLLAASGNIVRLMSELHQRGDTVAANRLQFSWHHFYIIDFHRCC